MRISPIAGVQTHRTCGARVLDRLLGNIRSGVELDFNSTGLACFMRIDLDRPDAHAVPASDEIPDVGGACGGKPALLRPAPDCARDRQ
jgi:hypothetical protein